MRLNKSHVPYLTNDLRVHVEWVTAFAFLNFCFRKVQNIFVEVLKDFQLPLCDRKR